MQEPLIHPMAPAHLPGFIPGADGSDTMMTIVVVFLLVLVLLIGAFYFTLHALPEQLAHEAGSTQMQVVGILALLALFTHNNVFWVAALLLAALQIPDFLSPIESIARSLKSMQEGVPQAPDPAPALGPDPDLASDLASETTAKVDEVPGEKSGGEG